MDRIPSKRALERAFILYRRAGRDHRVSPLPRAPAAPVRRHVARNRRGPRMYPERELSRLAAHKTVLRRRILLRRVQCAEAAAGVAQPFAWLDRLRAIWGQLLPVAQAAAAPLGVLLLRAVFSAFGRFRTCSCAGVRSRSACCVSSVPRSRVAIAPPGRRGNWPGTAVDGRPDWPAGPAARIVFTRPRKIAGRSQTPVGLHPMLVSPHGSAGGTRLFCQDDPSHVHPSRIQPA